MSEKQKRLKQNKLTPLCSAADNMTLLIEDLIEKLRMIVAQERPGDELDAKYIKELVAAMKDLTSVIRNLNDLPTFAEKFDMELAEKKLQLDRQKLEGAEQSDNEVTVKMSEPVRTWSE